MTTRDLPLTLLDPAYRCVGGMMYDVVDYAKQNPGQV